MGLDSKCPFTINSTRLLVLNSPYKGNLSRRTHYGFSLTVQDSYNLQEHTILVPTPTPLVSLSQVLKPHPGILKPGPCGPVSQTLIRFMVSVVSTKQNKKKKKKKIVTSLDYLKHKIFRVSPQSYFLPNRPCSDLSSSCQSFCDVINLFLPCLDLILLSTLLPLVLIIIFSTVFDCCGVWVETEFTEQTSYVILKQK